MDRLATGIAARAAARRIRGPWALAHSPMAIAIAPQHDTAFQ